MYILTSYQDSGVIEIRPNGPTMSERFLYLSFWAEVWTSLSLFRSLVRTHQAYVCPLAFGCGWPLTYTYTRKIT